MLSKLTQEIFSFSRSSVELVNPSQHCSGKAKKCELFRESNNLLIKDKTNIIHLRIRLDKTLRDLFQFS